MIRGLNKLSLIKGYDRVIITVPGKYECPIFTIPACLKDKCN